MTLSSGIARNLPSLHARALRALIVALYALGGASSINAQTLPEDLSGRWTSQRYGYVLDVTRCGAEWCGIKLNPDRSCGALALRLAQLAATDAQRRLIGTLSLEPSVRTYHVNATARASSAERPDELHLLGNPNEPPQPFTRTINFQDILVRGPGATCTAEGKLS